MAKRDSLASLRADFLGMNATLKAIELKLDPNPENKEFILRPFEPMLDAYNAAGTLRKWIMSGLSLTLVLFGIVWTGLQIFASKISIRLP